MNLNTVLLASAAALVAVPAAQAADLPSKKAAPVEYVRVCSTYGAGFFYIPGTDTCIRIGGRARYEYEYREPYSRSDNTTGSRATGRVYMDARTATEYGLLRAYVRYDVMRRVGTMLSGTSNRTAYAFTGTGVDFNGKLQTAVDLNRAFVQLGGLTAGRSQSFFDFYAGDLEYVGTTAGSSMTTNLLAYTASFGGGFSATLSVEDPVERRNLIAGNGGTVNGENNKVDGVTTPISNYAGSGVPDVVANLRYEGGWGAAQLSGAVHQVRAINTTASTVGYAPDAKYGFAVNAGVKINLPMLAAGDQLWLQGTYTKGANSYVVSNPFGWGTAGLPGVGAMGNVKTVDAVALSTTGAGSLDLTTVWGLTGAVLHYWTPTVRQALHASYIKTDYSNDAVKMGFRDYNYWEVGTNVTWSPVKDLDIGFEVDYVKQSVSGGPIVSSIKSDGGKLVSSDSQVIGRFRIVRDF
jgi:hypothetical protein